MPGIKHSLLHNTFTDSTLILLHFDVISRVLLVSAASLGTLSVILDVLSVAIFFEEGFKLVAELIMVCALIRKVE